MSQQQIEATKKFYGKNYDFFMKEEKIVDKKLKENF